LKKLSHFHLSEKPHILTTIPGPKSIEMLKRQQELEGAIVSYPKSIPIAIHRAKGAIIEDVDGNQFIDFFAGAGVLNVGHCNEDVLTKVSEQQKLLIHALDFPTENKLTAIKRILENLPDSWKGKFKVSFGGPTGSDAVEAAIKLAKLKTGRDSIIAFMGGYHGMTSTALGLTSNTAYRTKLQNLQSNIHFVPYSYCYRCSFNQKMETCKFECAQYLKNILENPHSGIPKPAAIIIEPVQGEGGNISPKPGYLEELVSIAHAHDVLVIFDEVQCGFFRTGKLFTCLMDNIVPDIITFSKGFGGIGYPIAGLIYKKSIEAWGTGDHIGTFRGNQVSLAAMNGAMDFVQDYSIGEHVNEMSKYLFKGLEEIKMQNKFIGEVRGRGLMIGIEFVKDVYTKEPYPELVKRIRSNCLQKGLIFEVGGHFDNVIRFVPPLIITKKIIDEALKILASSLEECR
jgi:diaminobutyrate-2-oxoglutarate transaminase